MNRLNPIRVNLNNLPHQKTYIHTGVRLAVSPIRSDLRFGEAKMPMTPWHPLKKTTVAFINKKEILRRATLDPWFFFQLVTKYSSDEVRAIEQHEMLHHWANLLKS